MSPIKTASAMQVEVAIQMFTIRALMITSCLLLKWTSLTMSRMHAIPSMWVTARDRSKTCLKTCIPKAKLTCSSIIIPTITEVVGKEITTLQELAIQHLDKSSVSYGEAPVEIVNRITKCKEVASRNPELFLDKLMLTLRSKCTVIGTSETIYKFRRKKTWI